MLSREHGDDRVALLLFRNNSNIVGNAIKFTLQGYVALRANVLQERAVVRIEVEDTGGGIPPEKIDALFQAYTQADSSIKTIIKGLVEKDLAESGDRAIQAVNRANRNMLLFVSAGMVFGIGFGLLLGRNITLPLKQLVQAANQIATGDLAANLVVKNQDEFGRLAVAFQNMIAYIRNVARVAETISTGNVQVAVAPQSERDVLNISLQRMIGYIHNIATLTERISNKELQVEVTPQSEHDVLNHALGKMLVNLRTMIQAIEQQNWVQQGLNQLNSGLLGEESLLEVCNKAIRFVARYVNAGSGVLYVYDADARTLRLYSSFAFVEREHVSNQYRLGEGVVGQVALEKSPILLKNIRREQAVITTGVTSHAPLNTYTFPLLYDRDLYGVLELASFEPFDEAKQRFLNETNQAIATSIFSTILLSKMLGRNEKGTLTDKAIKQADVIQQAGEELLRLINDILDLSKIEAGKVSLHPLEFASESLLDTFRDLFHLVAEEKNVRFMRGVSVSAQSLSWRIGCANAGRHPEKTCRGRRIGREKDSGGR